MSSLLEMVLGWSLVAVTFFDGIKASQGDDELISRCKELQRAWGYSSSLISAAVTGQLNLGATEVAV